MRSFGTQVCFRGKSNLFGVGSNILNEKDIFNLVFLCAFVVRITFLDRAYNL
jgi:hypothetical protein